MKEERKEGRAAKEGRTGLKSFSLDKNGLVLVKFCPYGRLDILPQKLGHKSPAKVMTARDTPRSPLFRLLL